MLPRLTANDYSSWPRGDPPNPGAFCKARSHNHFGHFLSISSKMKAGHGFSALSFVSRTALPFILSGCPSL